LIVGAGGVVREVPAAQRPNFRAGKGNRTLIL
jgi:hypothetical protein